MKRVMIFSMILVFSMGSCNSQNKENKPTEEKNPKTNVIVNKEYDEDGNLIRYDSTYSYVYSSTEGDSILRDSLIGEFRSQFNQKYFFSEDPYFKELFFEDSLMPLDFFKEDFFEKRFRFNRELMDNLFREMDSVKNYYFRNFNDDSLMIK